MTSVTTPPAAMPAGPALRRPGDALSRAAIGTVAILWNNVDVAELRLGTDALTILDEIARTGYEGTQLGLGFPEGTALQTALAQRGLRLAEVYASLPATVDGPTGEARAIGEERLRLLHDGGGDILNLAVDLSPERDERAGRVSDPETPVLTDAGWTALGAVVDSLAEAARDLGHRTAFHPHAGTFVESPAEAQRLADVTDPELVGICLDVGHITVGGGDPVAILRSLGERVTHVHLKDVDPDVLARLRGGQLAGFTAAVGERLFTELGAGILDLDGVIGVLAARDYDGWLIVEQDSAWGPPSESAAIGRRILATALRRAGAAGAATSPAGNPESRS
jgi:inosose dehydratase